MRQLVLFGAGNIGRSFIGQIFAANGYEVVFVDINRRVIDELNRRGSYNVVIKHPDGHDEILTVAGVRGVDASDTEQVARTLADATIAATAVGAGALPAVAGLICEGLRLRRTVRPGEPLDVILAENVRDAASLVARIVAEAADGSALLESLGLVQTSIGKMVPIVTAETSERDPLVVFAEPYNTLIVDARGFRAPVPNAPQIKAVDDIRAYVDRKLFLHNLGHAAVAYCAYRHDTRLVTIADAVKVEPVRAAAHGAMEQAGAALAAAYPRSLTLTDLQAHRDDLLQRFANQALGDTIHRVGRDLPRKLSRDDRIVGAMRLAVHHALPFDRIAHVYRAALGFLATDETGRPYPEDDRVVAMARRRGTTAVLSEISGLRPGTPEDDAVIREVVSLPDTRPGR